MTTNDPYAGTGTGDQSKASEHATAVAELARDDAASTADTAKQQAGRVADEARFQVQDLVGDAASQLRSQAESQTSNLGRTMHTWGDNLHALADGRTDEAGEVQDLTHRIADQMQGVADRIEDLGFDGAISELQRFARRRPGAFLAGAAVLGFAASRVAQGARDNHSSDGEGRAAIGSQGSPAGVQQTPPMRPSSVGTPGATAPVSPPPPPLPESTPSTAGFPGSDPRATTSPSGRSQL